MNTGLKLKVLLTSIILLIIFSISGYGQERGGVLSGIVMDDSGATLPGIQVAVTGKALMGKKIAFTNENGKFRIPNMPVGVNYTVEFTLEGFKKVVKKDVRISLAKTTSVSATMTLGVLTESIVVTGKAPVMDATSSTTQTNITHEVIETLANDRQYQTIMEMMPGAIPGNNPAMMGASTSDNMYQMDGADSTDPLTKTWSSAGNFDNFEEMQVISNGVPAEYGRGTGAVINVVTKSGSNEIHGTARISMTKTDWNTKASEQNISFSDATRYLNETRPAINLGGPIIKDHIWFFGSYEKRNKFKPATWYTSQEEALTGSPSGEGNAYYKGHYASAKVTMNFGKLSFVGNYMEDPIDIPDRWKYGNYTGWGTNPTSAYQGGNSMNFDATMDLGSNTYIVAKVGMIRNELGLIPSEEVAGPWIYHTDTGFMTGSSYYDYRTERNHNQYILNINHYMETGFGYHDIKVGAEMFNINNVAAMNYLYVNGEMEQYRNGLTYYREVRHYDGVPKQANVYNNNLTFYIQDKWEVAKGLTLNIGLRAESGTWKNHGKETIMELGFGDNIAPRLGAAYSFGNNKITANYSRLFDIYGNALVSNSQTGDFTSKKDVYYGEALTGIPGWTYQYDTYVTPPPGATTIADDIKPSYMDELGIGFERVLGTKYAVSVSYLHRIWKNKIDDYDPDGDGVYHYKNVDDYNDPMQGVDWGNTSKKYDSFIVTLKKNLGDDKFQFLASYTWGKLKGFDQGGEEITDAESMWGDAPYVNLNSFGYMENDVRHMVKFHGSYILPFDINFGVGFAWYSGKPYTNTVDMYYEDGGATYHDGNEFIFNADPLGTSGRYAAVWQLDVRLEKKFKFKELFSASVYIDVFNLLNNQIPIMQRTNLGSGQWNNQAGGDYTMTGALSNHGNATEFMPPMSFFIGAKIEW